MRSASGRISLRVTTVPTGSSGSTSGSFPSTGGADVPSPARPSAQRSWSPVLHAERHASVVLPHDGHADFIAAVHRRAVPVMEPATFVERRAVDCVQRGHERVENHVGPHDRACIARLTSGVRVVDGHERLAGA